MLIYVIMSSFKTSNQEPISINYVGSNHLISCAVEGNCNMQKLGHHMNIGLGMGVVAGKPNPFSIV
jgi:hypothetical protein